MDKVYNPNANCLLPQVTPSRLTKELIEGGIRANVRNIVAVSGYTLGLLLCCTGIGAIVGIPLVNLVMNVK